MRTVRAARAVEGTVHEAESCWYDTGRWSEWVDGLSHIVEVTGNWPEPGATVTWESGPAGRGRVVERVLWHEALAGQSVEVLDESIEGRQSVSFTPLSDGVEVELSLDYQITRRSIFTPLVDWLFIRRAMTNSLDATLARFGQALAATRGSGVG